jgi:hypothetical protein
VCVCVCVCVCVYKTEFQLGFPKVTLIFQSSDKCMVIHKSTIIARQTKVLSHENVSYTRRYLFDSYDKQIHLTEPWLNTCFTT